MARPSKISNHKKRVLCEAAAAGGSMRDCAGVARISVQTLYNWLDAYPRFREDFEEARSRVRLRKLLELSDGERQRDNRAIEAWLSRTGGDYAHVDRRPAVEPEVRVDVVERLLEQALASVDG